MGLFKMSASSYEGPPVGRISFAPEFDSKSEREALSRRLDVKQFVPASTDLSWRDRQSPPNPNPRRFKVECVLQIGKHLVCEVTYPDCTNYEGKKVLVFADTTRAQLESAVVLDPHFTDAAPAWALVPVARFEPTLRGHRLARMCAGNL